MTVSDYIRQTFLDFGVRLSDASLFGIMGRESLNADAEVDSYSITPIDVAIVKSIPILLLTPQSVSEGGFSISRASKDSILSWYALRCGELGLEDELSDTPSIRFM